MRNPIAVVFTTAILVCTLFAPALFAGQNGCTIANVAGTYGYVGFGTVRPGNPLGLPAGTSSSIGTLTFDGKGNLLIIDTERIDEFFIPPDTPYPSTYTVTKQCVVTFTVTAWAEAGLPGPHFKGVFVANRNKLVATSLLPGANIDYVNTTRIAINDQN
ncbi:MAG: hypothetical protein LAO03_21385 [Acidobacteriia bacterium]|nr:hypothetical protein [Terriglobia bacterium]